MSDRLSDTSEIKKLEKSNTWLQRMKDESWEAELLVSAIAIFGTFQLFKVISWATNKFIDFLPSEQYYIAYFIVFMGLLAVSILVSMFVIHFLLRAYWIGLVGLNSVFPDYSLEDSAYSEIYTKKILSILPKLKDSIQKVDDICSVIFSAAFCLLLIYTYFAITATIYLTLFNLLSSYIPSYILLIPICITVFLIVVQTLFAVIANLKTYKDNEQLQLFFFKVVKLTSIVSLGPLYKYLLQITMTFGSNFKKNKSLVAILLLFVSSGIFVSVYQASNTNLFYLINQAYLFDDTKTFAGYYRSENENIDFLLTPEIDSDIIAQKVVKLFIPIFEHERTLRKGTCNKYNDDDKLSRKENRLKKKNALLDCYHQYHEVFINTVRHTPKYKKYFHPQTNQFGILTYIKLTDIKEGENYIQVKKNYGTDEHNSEWTIPFQYLITN